MSLRRSLLFVLLAVLAIPASAQDEIPVFTTDFSPDEFAARRSAVYDAIGSDAIAILQGEATPRGYVRFRQSNEFYYLSGIEVPHSYLLLDGQSRTATIYLPHKNEGRERSEGPMLSAEDGDRVRALSGLDRVAAQEDLSATLHGLLRRGTLPTIYTLFQPAEGLAESRDLGVRRVSDRLADAWDGRPSREAHFIGLLRERIPGASIADLNPILDNLRLIKSEAEIRLIKKATRLSGLALMEAMRSVEPGVVEHEIDAVAKFIYFRHGAQGDAYYSLVAGGTNAYMPHYHMGQKTLQSGELMLMDYAPDVGYYMSDVTRMMPVDGRFTPDYRELYGFYVRAYRAILDRIRPGVTANQIRTEAVEEMRSTLASWRFGKTTYAAAAKNFVDSYENGSRGAYGRLGHGVGMATHDVGSFDGPLRAGMVFTIEPALRVPEENLYIRLEDLIVIREDGVEIVSDFVPMEVDDIEALMAEEGILQRYPEAVFTSEVFRR